MTDLVKTPGLFGRQLLPREVAKVNYDAGWTDVINNVRMGATVTAESGRYSAAVGAVNVNGSQDWGMYQVNNRHHSFFGYADQEDFYRDCVLPEMAAHFARVLFLADRQAGGTGFGPWFAYGSQNYHDALPAACGGCANMAAIILYGKPVV